VSEYDESKMAIPTELIGSIPRPLDLVEAVKTARDDDDSNLDPLYDAAIRIQSHASRRPARR
jgi:hypothetical protein